MVYTENPECLRGGHGRWWDTWPAQVPDGRPDRRKRRTGSIPRSVLERSEMRGEGTDSLEDQLEDLSSVTRDLE
jgi:hypothetical protein